MSVYKALAAAVASQGEVELPDGKVYTVRGLTVGELLKIQQLSAESAADSVALPFYVNVVVRATVAPREVVESLTPAALATVVSMAQWGVDAVSAAIAAEAPASGNGAAAATRRSTSRKKR